MKFPKLLGLLIAIALTFSACSFDTSEDLQANVLAPFPDVPITHKYVDVISYLKGWGVINGYGDGTFGPEKSLSRAEFMKIIFLGSGYELEDLPHVTKAPFPDVPVGEWYTDYVAFAANNDYIQGYPDGKFRPGQKINKVEALKILGELVGWKVDSVGSVQNNYSDIDLGQWYGPYVSYAIDRNLLDDSGSLLGAATEITRGQMVEYMYRDFVTRELSVDRYELKYDTEILGYSRSGVSSIDLGSSVTADPVGEVSYGQIKHRDEATPQQYDEVVKLIREDILVNSKYKQELVAFMEPKPYVAGSVLSPYGSDKKVTMKSDTWVALIDNHPSALWDHDVQFVLIDADSLEYEIWDEVRWPVINGISLWSNMGMRSWTDFWVWPETPDTNRLIGVRSGSNGAALSSDFANNNVKNRFYLASSLNGLIADLVCENGTCIDFEGLKDEADKKKASDFDSTCTKCTKSGKKVALLIEGFNEADNDSVNVDIKLADYNRWELLPMYKGLKAQGYSTTYLNSYVGEKADSNVPDGVSSGDMGYTTLANIEAAFNDLASKVNDCCDDVVIVFAGHGSEDGMIEMNPQRVIPTYHWKERSSLSDPLEKVDDSTIKVGAKGGGYLSTANLKTLLNKLKTCKVKVLIYSCYSGKHIDNGIADLPEEGCLCRAIYTSSMANRLTWGGMDSWIRTIGKGLIEGDGMSAALVKAHKNAANQENRFANFSQFANSSMKLCNDNDGDGICNGLEIESGMNPDNTDSDKDGISDTDEWGYDPDGKNEFGDPTNPIDPDTDGDKMPDGKEKKNHTNPHSDDTDGDGASDWHESVAGSDPLDPDTDKDGCNDGQELMVDHTSPTDPNSKNPNCSENYCINPELGIEFEINGYTLKYAWVGAVDTFDIVIDGEKWNKNYGEPFDLGDGTYVQVDQGVDGTLCIKRVSNPNDTVSVPDPVTPSGSTGGDRTYTFTDNSKPLLIMLDPTGGPFTIEGFTLEFGEITGDNFSIAINGVNYDSQIFGILDLGTDYYFSVYGWNDDGVRIDLEVFQNDVDYSNSY